MTAVPSALAEHYALGTTTTAYLLRITRSDGAEYRFASSSRDVTYEGDLYDAAQGLDVSSIVYSAGLAVDNLELQTLDDGTVFTYDDIRTGIWRNAVFLITRVNYASPEDGAEDLLGGTFGNVESRRGTVLIELRGWQQWMQQTVGSVSSQTCRARLGDSNCRKDLTAFTHSGTVTSVTDSQTFTASALTQDADYFGNGHLTWLTGTSAGTEHQIKTHNAGGVLVLMVPMLVTIDVGDTFTIVAGCRKRHDRTSSNPSGVSDCYDKFDNVLNFYGERLLPRTDSITAPP